MDAVGTGADAGAAGRAARGGASGRRRRPDAAGRGRAGEIPKPATPAPAVIEALPAIGVQLSWRADPYPRVRRIRPLCADYTCPGSLTRPGLPGTEQAWCCLLTVRLFTLADHGEQQVFCADMVVAER